MAMINHYTAIGRIAANAELRYTVGGTACMHFSICVNDSYKKDGEWIEKPNFFRCTVWGRYAEAMQKHMNKGKLIGIEGKLNQNVWEDSNHVKRNDITIVIDNITLLSFPKGEKDKAATGYETDPETGETVPF
ncbi:MAG: single-stranded DNA-binding protein [Treponema sp.]|jgi:single-strand DNA-binding protein|nr:single-stranded DNA-binding protein [Treponema sp.]